MTTGRSAMSSGGGRKGDEGLRRVIMIIIIIMIIIRIMIIIMIMIMIIS